MHKEKYFGISRRIARWKLDTLLENWLASKADNSAFFRFLYLKYYAIFDSRYYLKGRQMAYDAIKDHAVAKGWGMDDNDIIDDMIYCLHRYGFSFQDYIAFDFPRKSSLARNEYISDKLRYYYCDILNGEHIEALMTDKYKCYQTYEQYYKREILGCYCINELNKFLSFYSKNNAFIYKPLGSHSGRGIEIIQADKQFNPEGFYLQKIQDGPFVVEELIQQGYEMAQLHPNSINTLRVVSFRNADTVDILLTFLRMGVANSVVDNGGAGGIMANVNIDSGIVDSKGMDFTGAKYAIHPDTNIPIIGYQIPQWLEAKELIAQLAKHIEGTTFISWDIAFSKNGWCLVEANDCGALKGAQMTYGRGLKRELFEMMDDYFVHASNKKNETQSTTR